MYNSVNHPKHYTSHPSGIEVIQITKHENFCCGNAIKYILRRKLKGNEIEDLRKAVWYLQTEIESLVNAISLEKDESLINNEHPCIKAADNSMAEEQKRLQEERERFFKNFNS